MTTTFDEWWEADGAYLDPDTSDVPWFDKRKELCRYAWSAAEAGAWRPTREEVAQAISEATDYGLTNVFTEAATEAVMALSPPTSEAK